MRRALLVAGLAVFAALATKAAAQDAPWIAFDGTWSATGQRQSVPVEGGGTALILQASGSVILEHGEGLTRGFRGEAIAFDDGAGMSVGRAVWTDASGERLFSRLSGEPFASGRRITATITGGTGRYANAEGEYSFYWKYVVASDEGSVEGRAVNLKGKLRLRSAAR